MTDSHKTKKQLINTLSSGEAIAESKRLETKLRSTKNYFESILRNSLDLMITVKKDGTIGYTNHLLDAMTGYRQEDVLGKHFIDFIPRHMKDFMWEKWKEINEGISGIYETQIIKADGTLMNCLISTSAVEGFKEFLVSIRDLTMRMQAEEALRESEERYRTVIEQSADCIYLADADTRRILESNPSFRRLLGYSPGEIDGLTLYDFIVHEQQDIDEKIGQMLRGSSCFIGERRYRRKDGTLVHVEVSASPISYRGRNVICGVARDITGRKRVEEALQESEEKFRAISNTAADAILVMDNDGRISYWNPAAEKMFGYSSEEAKDKELHLFLAPERYHESYKQGFSKFRKTGQGPAIGNISEFFAMRKNGTEFPIEVSTSAIQIRGKWYAVGIIRDITERKRLEKARIESEQKYRALFEESKDVVYISTPEGKFLDINPAGIELFGYASKEEMLQIDIARDLYAYPGHREGFQQVLAKQGYVKDYEVPFRRKDGEQVAVLLTTSIVRDEKGRIIAYQGIMKDITERKRLEQQLLQAQKMEAIGQLAGGVAHDFNNILTAIIGYGSFLQMNIGKDNPLSNYVTQILTSAERAANLTQALLAFSRKQIINPKPVNLNEIISGVEKLLSRLIGEDIELSTVLTDKDLTVMADSGQIEQVLMNLATNARDAMPDGGSLLIGSELVELDNEFVKAHGFGKPGFYALISVQDTGHGIDRGIKERIFEPFFTTKEVGKGTGLGLAMVYGTVKQHDGYINVYSESDRGTIFKVYLPLIKSMVEEAKAASHPVLKGGIETVLIAEDDSQVRGFTKELLKEFGYKVLEAEDGEDAIMIFDENRDAIGLLVLDVIMPKKNGREVYDYARKEKPDVKAIFTSGYTSDIVHKKKILEEGLEFMLKPISPEELLIKVREVLDR